MSAIYTQLSERDINMAAQQTGPNLGGLFAVCMLSRLGAFPSNFRKLQCHTQAVDTDKSGAIDATELQSALSSGGWREFS